MTTDPFATAAGIEFKRRFQNLDAYRSDARQFDLFRVFRSGMQYAASQEPTDAEVQAARDAVREVWREQDRLDLGHVGLMEAYARAALSAARAARRDEKNKP